MENIINNVTNADIILLYQNNIHWFPYELGNQSDCSIIIVSKSDYDRALILLGRKL